MCGIVGYFGSEPALSLVFQGLQRLEKRGYDSSGISFFHNKELITIKAKGRLYNLGKKLGNQSIKTNLAIGHTRWATHGKPNEINAHPQKDMYGEISVVHNGIIENYNDLKTQLIKHGFEFKSETDTEVIANLIAFYYQGDLLKAVQFALRKVVGTYGLLVIHQNHPDLLLAARRGSPVTIGLAEHGIIVASSGEPIIEHTKKTKILSDGEIAIIKEISITNKKDGRIDKEANRLDVVIRDSANGEVNKETFYLEGDIEDLSKDNFPHFMLKEIFEQYRKLIDTMRGRILFHDCDLKLGGLENHIHVMKRLTEINKIVLVACGTSKHAAEVAESWFEGFTKITTKVIDASEFIIRPQLIDNYTVFIAISQSGETMDVYTALKQAKQSNALTLGVVNVVNSLIARETDAGVYTHASIEVGVASTKTFTCQLVVLLMMSLLIAIKRKTVSQKKVNEIINELESIPDKIRDILNRAEQIKELAKSLNNKSMVFLGNEPVAKEGALKLKEVSYIHAEGMSPGAIKHGPIALVEKDFPVLFIIPKTNNYSNFWSNLEEVSARDGRIIAIATYGDKEIIKKTNEVFFVPETISELYPILTVIPLQLLAYYTAVELGKEPDKPRNLAKTVTVK